MVLLVFGPPLLDELSRLHVRRQTNRARAIVHGPISLVPDEDEQISLHTTRRPLRKRKNLWSDWRLGGNLGGNLVLLSGGTLGPQISRILVSH